MISSQLCEATQESCSHLQGRDQNRREAEPLVQMFVGHVAGVLPVLGPRQREQPRVGAGHPPVVEAVEAEQRQGAEVEAQPQAVVEAVGAGEGGADPELAQHQLQPPPPLRVPRRGLARPQPPDRAEAGEQLGAARVAVEHGCGEQREAERGGGQQQPVEAGVGEAEEGGLQLRAAWRPRLPGAGRRGDPPEVAPVPGTGGGVGPGDAGGGDTGQPGHG